MLVSTNKKSSTSCKFPGDALRSNSHCPPLLGIQTSIRCCLLSNASLRNPSAALLDSVVVGSPSSPKDRYTFITHKERLVALKLTTPILHHCSCLEDVLGNILGAVTMYCIILSLIGFTLEKSNGALSSLLETI